jgi:lipopolysaccharide/colanic/teichoic acid biosynthesis glycosyltransferase
MKRAIDFLGACFALAALSPLMALVALLVRVTLGSPVLFRQIRPGLHGRPFLMVKFRTMRDIPALPDAERLTRIGRLIRRAGLDELPALVNVFHGEMSLVGPRPLLPEYLTRYTPEQARRHEVKPGLTGWAVVHGRNALTWEEKFRLDVWYVDHGDLLLDLEILARTPFTLLCGKGASAPGHATMPEFRGSRP